MTFWRKSAGNARLRVFFATDIHGSEQCFKKWLSACRVYKVEALILGGDITGKTLIPIVAEPNGIWSALVIGTREQARDAKELEDLQARIRKMGGYDIIVDPEEKSALDDSPELVEKAFERAMRASLQRWLALAEERLEPGTPCFSMLGNDDLPELADVLRSSHTVTYAEDGVVELPDGREMISIGYSTPTPWLSPREISEEEMASRLSDLAGRLMHPERSIFNIHCPPKGTSLDQAPLLDASMRPMSSAGGGVQMTSVGSQAVRDVIERFQPAVGLHGHVHECSAGTQIGRTRCINPGSDYLTGSLRGAIVEFDGDRAVSRWQLTRG